MINMTQHVRVISFIPTHAGFISNRIRMGTFKRYIPEKGEVRPIWEVSVVNFALDEDILFLKKNVRDFIQSEVEAVAMQIEAEDRIPERIIDLSKEMGLFGLSIPEAYGGLGIGMVGKCALY